MINSRKKNNKIKLTSFGILDVECILGEKDWNSFLF